MPKKKVTSDPYPELMQSDMGNIAYYLRLRLSGSTKLEALYIPVT